jgi:hypothetical protein
VNEDSLSGDIHPTPYCEFYEKEGCNVPSQSITNLEIHFESNSSTLDPKDEIAVR